MSSSDEGDCRKSRKTRILLQINEDTIQSRGDEEFLSFPENELVEFATTWPEQNYSQVQEKGIKYFLHQHPDTLWQKCDVEIKCIGESSRNWHVLTKNQTVVFATGFLYTQTPTYLDKWWAGLPVNDEVPSSTPAVVNKEQAGSNPAITCANSDGQLATAVLGVQVTWMQFPLLTA